MYSNNNNIISGNTANYNDVGIRIHYSNSNTVSGNTLIGNDVCIVEYNCEENIFENNDCGKGSRISFESIIVISSISGGAVIGVVTILLIRSKRKK